jgi:hypothetical protein
MSGPNTPKTPVYTVTAISPEADVTPVGGVVPSQRVSFTTATGVSNSILIPDTVINDVAEVQARVEAKIRQLQAIMNLGGM